MATSFQRTSVHGPHVTHTVAHGPHITLVTGDLMLSFGLLGNQACIWYSSINAHIHKINLKNFKLYTEHKKKSQGITVSNKMFLVLFSRIQMPSTVMSACTHAFSFSDYWLLSWHTDSAFASTSNLHRERRHHTTKERHDHSWGQG